MRPSRIVFLSALTVVGGTMVARLLKGKVSVPGFSPNG